MAAIREAKAKGAKILAIANVVGSSIPRLADYVIYTHAGPEIGVASTKAFTTQVVTMSHGAVPKRASPLVPSHQPSRIATAISRPSDAYCAAEKKRVARVDSRSVSGGFETIRASRSKSAAS